MTSRSRSRNSLTFFAGFGGSTPRVDIGGVRVTLASTSARISCARTRPTAPMARISSGRRALARASTFAIADANARISRASRMTTDRANERILRRDGRCAQELPYRIRTRICMSQMIKSSSRPMLARTTASASGSVSCSGPQGDHLSGRIASPSCGHSSGSLTCTIM